MRVGFRTALEVLLLLASSSAALAADFSGNWAVAICPRERTTECSHASFTLIQEGQRICGDHSFVTAGAGRMNEGFPGSVRGAVVSDTAILVVTSGRNDGIVLAKATRIGPDLRWETLEEIKPGTPPGDALIFAKGVLKRQQIAVDEGLVAACTVR